MQPVLDFLSTPHGVVAAVVFCGFAAAAIFRVHALAVKERKWCAQVANWEAGLGLSPIMVAPWSDLAAGDLPAFAGSIEAKIKYLADAANRERECISVIKSLYATPTGKIAIDKLYADLSAGATAAQLQTDAAAVAASAPASPGPGPVASDVTHLVAKIEALTANPALADLLHLLPPDQGLLGSALLSAGHAVGASTAPDQPGPAAAPVNVVPVPSGAAVGLKVNAPA